MAFVWARDLAQLEDVLARVRAAQMPHYSWKEPDQFAVRRFFAGQPFTALAVGPVDPDQRHLFRDLEKVSYSPVGSTLKPSASKAGDAGENPAGRASLPCS